MINFKVLTKRILGLLPNVKIDIEIQYQRFGSDYGGFEVYTKNLNQSSVVYSFGIGEDITFDIAIIKEFNCKVYAYDPTPKVAKWISNQVLPDNFKFFPVGLSDHDGSIKFYTPINPEHISHTSVKLADSQHEMEVPCNQLSTLLRQNSHTYIDLLKVDIEGFEYAVLKNILDKNIAIQQIVIEFHHNFKGIGNSATEEIVQSLKKNGYLLFSISENYQEFSFIKQSAL